MELDPGGGDGESSSGEASWARDVSGAGGDRLRPGPEAQERVLGISQNLASPQTLRRVKQNCPIAGQFLFVKLFCPFLEPTFLPLL